MLGMHDMEVLFPNINSGLFFCFANGRVRDCFVTIDMSRDSAIFAVFPAGVESPQQRAFPSLIRIKFTATRIVNLTLAILLLKNILL